MFGFKKEKDKRSVPAYYKVWDEKTKEYEDRISIDHVPFQAYIEGPDAGNSEQRDGFMLANPKTWGGEAEEKLADEEKGRISDEWLKYVKYPGRYRRNRRLKKAAIIGGSGIGGFLVAVLIGGIANSLSDQNSEDGNVTNEGNDDVVV